MKLSRKWLNEIVYVAQVGYRDFAEAKTISGSKLEITEVLNESLKNVVVGKLLSLEHHPDSDHMWVCQLDVGEAEPVQIVTGAWNIHAGCCQAQVPPPRRRQDREGQAPGRGVLRYALLPEGAGPHRRA